ncbi:MAG: sulfite exporter TauE/SafE family protein [Ruminococcaceae bacterium]|nr:sulfite exporter TauE/SafE family protein [Oscillospiraceae bacterium]
MTYLPSLFAFLISLFASVIGAICGIGGGVIIKPVLDLFSIADVAAASFLSCCTVCSMSCYSVIRSLRAGGGEVDLKVSTPLSVGAAIGGIAGNRIFSLVKSLFDDPDTVGAPQALCLALITVGTLIYTLNKERIHTLRVTNKAVCLLIGGGLGIMSSFLGIGGGPINLVVLFFFFSMETKIAAANSLYIILFSQVLNLITTLISGSVPAFAWSMLLLMITGGIAGGMIGRAVNKKIDGKTVDKLFIALMAVIILMSIYNTLKYSVL